MTDVQRHFDKLLCVFVMAFFSFLMIHLVHHDANPKLIEFLQTSISGVLGALLTLITGSRFAQRSGDGNGNGKAQ